MALLRWYKDFGKTLGLSIDSSSGTVSGDPKIHPRLIANADESIVIVQEMDGHGKQKERLVVSKKDKAAERRRTEMPKTNVALLPFITIDGSVVEVLIFKFTGNKELLKTEMKREVNYVKTRTEELRKSG